MRCACREAFRLAFGCGWRAGWRLGSLLLVLGVLAELRATTTQIRLEILEGKASLRCAPKDPFEPLLAGQSATLWGGTTVRFEPGTRIKLDKGTGPTERSFPQAAEETFPSSATPSSAAMENALSGLFLKPDGGLRAEGNILFSPASRSRLVLDRLPPLRWQPLKAGQKVRLEVAVRGKVLWGDTIDGALGELLPPALLTAELRKAVAGGATRFNFSAFPVEDGAAEVSNDCSLLQAAEVAALQAQLAALADETGAWAHLLQAGVYEKFGATDLAFVELEIALRDPVLGRQAHWLRCAAELARRIGDLPRVREFEARLQTLSTPH